MALDELKEKYRASPLSVRCTLCAAIGLGVGGYFYYDGSDQVAAEIATAQSLEQEIRTKFEAAKAQQLNLPKLEEQLAFTEEQLRKAKAALPDSYDVEGLLERTAIIAKELGLVMRSFTRGAEKAGATDRKYRELPIAVDLLGSFVQVASFFDRVIQVDNSVFIRNIQMERGRAPIRSDVRPGNAVSTESGEGASTPARAARERRANLRVATRADLVLFRSAENEQVAAGVPPAPGGAPAPGIGTPAPGIGTPAPGVGPQVPPPPAPKDGKPVLPAATTRNEMVPGPPPAQRAQHVPHRFAEGIERG